MVVIIQNERKGFAECEKCIYSFKHRKCIKYSKWIKERLTNCSDYHFEEIK